MNPARAEGEVKNAETPDVEYLGTKNDVAGCSTINSIIAIAVIGIAETTTAFITESASLLLITILLIGKYPIRRAGILSELRIEESDCPIIPPMSAMSINAIIRTLYTSKQNTLLPIATFIR